MDGKKKLEYLKSKWKAKSQRQKDEEKLLPNCKALTGSFYSRIFIPEITIYLVAQTICLIQQHPV